MLRAIYSLDDTKSKTSRQDLATDADKNHGCTY